MATRFELVLHGENGVALRAAGEEALAEIQRLDAQLSLYRPTSEIAHLNALAAERAVRVEPSLFRLLQQAGRLSRETNGGFDITIGPLMRCWGFMGGSGEMADESAVAEARSKVGMNLVELNENDFTVRFSRRGVMLDLGAIGKGYALERAAEILRENGIASALLHGGTSTVCAIGAPPETPAWNIAIANPATHFLAASEPRENVPSEERPLVVVPLKDHALSVSAVWGKSFSSAGRILGHVLDPRTGAPVQQALAAAVIVPS
ncbi:MAG: FAD:protein FMN transferase, partial [Verrucomicrobiales bacterium]|nr:FAD:protein FMN transferase [Verrucomicrobiales bacterium]